jgi:hypothetical protein
MYSLRESMIFGKYMGKSPAQIVFQDPNWVFWWAEEHKLYGAMGQWLLEVARKAKAIRLRTFAGEQLVVKYTSDPTTRRLVGVEIFPCAEPIPPEYSRTVDLSYSRRLNPSDKRGGEILASAVREHLFGPGVRITRRRADDFFAEDRHFAIGD